MNFLVDTKDQSVRAFPSPGLAARAALESLGVPLSDGADPVRAARDAMGDRMAILNLSGAFESIKDSGDGAAQELAAAFMAAVDKMYRK